MEACEDYKECLSFSSLPMRRAHHLAPVILNGLDWDIRSIEGREKERGKSKKVLLVCNASQLSLSWRLWPFFDQRGWWSCECIFSTNWTKEDKIQCTWLLSVRGYVSPLSQWGSRSVSFLYSPPLLREQIILICVHVYVCSFFCTFVAYIHVSANLCTWCTIALLNRSALYMRSNVIPWFRLCHFGGSGFVWGSIIRYIYRSHYRIRLSGSTGIIIFGSDSVRNAVLLIQLIM